MALLAKKAVSCVVCAALIVAMPGASAHQALAMAIERGGRASGGKAPGANVVPLHVPSQGLSAGIGAAPLQTHSAAPELPPLAAPESLAAAPTPTVAVSADDQLPEQDPTAINSSVAYAAHRFLLRFVGALGQVHSLRPAGAALSQRSIDAVWDARGVLADFDNTLVPPNAKFDAPIPDGIIKAWRAVKKSGKSLDVISDRPNTLDSLAGLPADVRAGAFVAVNVGGMIYRYNDAGEPIMVHQAPPISDEVKAKMREAGDAAARRLAAASIPILDRRFTPYRYTMRLPAGSSWQQVREAGEVLQEEMGRFDASLAVQARMAADPSNPPYVMVSIVSKSYAARYIAAQRGLAPKDVVILGDSSYDPRGSNGSAVLRRFGEKISGRALPERGNDTDAEMSRGLPGARSFSVGGAGDPRISKLIVLSPDGPATAQRVLMSVASRSAEDLSRGFQQGLKGHTVGSLDEKSRKIAFWGWLAGRTLYLVGFILSGAIAYPMLAQALVGAQGYTDVMSLGAVAAIFLAPMSGLVADHMSFRHTFAFNNTVRVMMAAAIPILVLISAATFWPLLIVALVSSWNVGSSMVGEGKMFPALAGWEPGMDKDKQAGYNKRLSELNAIANLHFTALNVLLGIFFFAGKGVDYVAQMFGVVPGLSSMFVLSGILGAVAAVIHWATIPNVALQNGIAKASAIVSGATAFERRHRAMIWAGLIAAGTGLFVLMQSALPRFATLPLVAAALVGLAATSDGLKTLWNHHALRMGAMLSMAYTFVVYPVGSILIPFAARALEGGGALQGQLQGALFFGQLLSGMALLPFSRGINKAVRLTVMGGVAAWLGFYLFPHNLAMAAAGVAAAGLLYCVSMRLTNRGWMRYAFVGLSALALPIAFWGNIPAFLLGIMIIGLVNLPNKITIDTIVQAEAKEASDNSGRLLGLNSALASISAAFGYASFGAIAAAFSPAFPIALWPMLAMFAGIGLLYWMGPRFFGKRLQKTNFTVAPPREYTGEELADVLAQRVENSGIKAIVTDYDGTLEDKTADDKAVAASPRVVALIEKLHELGVKVVVCSNHFFIGSKPEDPNNMTNLIGNRLSPQGRAGMMFVGQSGSRIDQYGEDGSEPKQPLWEETPFSEAENAFITPIFEAGAAKAGLAPGDYKIFYEKSRVLIEVRNHLDRADALYEVLAAANRANGGKYLVQHKTFPTMREHKVPYIQYFKAHKGTGARKAVELLMADGHVDAESQVLILGDDFITNDLFMAEEMPGAIAVSVGKTAARRRNVLQSTVRGATAIHDLLDRLIHLLEKDQSDSP